MKTYRVNYRYRDDDGTAYGHPTRSASVTVEAASVDDATHKAIDHAYNEARKNGQQFSHFITMDVREIGGEYEIKIRDEWRTVSEWIFRSWTGPRRHNGEPYTGPVYKLGTDTPAAVTRRQED